ncbi:ATP-dependent Clp protease adaptor ClpS [Riemerella columbipharyngis]|uniref:ATP-dependent Clp protease adaptor protein ClpS n=1 Tax=Riemerella columbipharyngis TaxID=1071918 RepID=A0A1G7FC63_9FLAO|nr:ATP-dependent Clp protease adaptor ClpS [Riemerella columbipharyngis]SDE73065.1 ATP-dependent Clp protease adaptor protein ClpS [Riemerella columbipharyngis]
MKSKALQISLSEGTKCDVKEQIEALDTSETPNLIVYNDDFHTFDYVIQCLMDICKHTHIQAEQCTMLIHYKGKCVVKTATYGVLKPMKAELSLRGLKCGIS